MSHWGSVNTCASNIIIINIITITILSYKYNNIIYHTYHRKDVTNFKSPLNIDILSIIYGSLLGDSYCIHNNNKTKISFYLKDNHNYYLLWFHRLISNLGYCNTKVPRITTRLVNRGKIIKEIRFNTWAYELFNIIHNEWYDRDNHKVLPNDIEYYLNPLTLAIWVMNNGIKINNNKLIISNDLSYNDNIKLIHILSNKYKLNCTIVKYYNKYHINILNESINDLYFIIKEYVVLSMKYKVML